MEISFSKIIMIGLVLLALSIVSIVFIGAYSQYSEVHLYMSRQAMKSSSKTVAVVACYTNRTSGHNYTAIHLYNYGEDEYDDNLTVFAYNGSHLPEYYEGKVFRDVRGARVIIPAKELIEVDVNLTDVGLNYNSEDYSLVLYWLEAGDVEVVRCLSP